MNPSRPFILRPVATSLFMVLFATFVFFMPNALGDPTNFVPANPVQTPNEIKPDFQTLSDFYKSAADAYNGGNPDVSKLQALQGQATKVTTAAQNISTWATQNCSS